MYLGVRILPIVVSHCRGLRTEFSGATGAVQHVFLVDTPLRNDAIRVAAFRVEAAAPGGSVTVRYVDGLSTATGFDGWGGPGLPTGTVVVQGVTARRPVIESMTLKFGGGPRFIRGECNDDGTLDISDALCMISWLFAGTAAPGCVAATNINGDGAVDISDVVYTLGFLFLGGPPPVEPFPGCGPGNSPADDVLGCGTAQKKCE